MQHRFAAPLLLAMPALGCAVPTEAAPSPAPAETANDMLTFPASFFATAQPATAYDMVLRVPGFLFDAGDADVRGLAGANGNVLIDGRWPAAKDDTLDSLLKRIPARAVLRIELIRGGGTIDMRGQPVLANVVLRQEAAIRGQIETAFGGYGDGRVTPSLRADISRRRGTTLTEASAYLYQAIDDEKGFGPRLRTNPDGSLRERARYDEQDTLRGAQFSLGHQQVVAGGRLQLNGSLNRLRERADTELDYAVPASAREQVRERETTDGAEIGAQWSRALASRLTLDLTALQRFSRNVESERSDDGATLQAVDADSHGSERIGRVQLHWQPSPRLSFEGGGEAAYNFLDSHSALAIDGVAVALPAANVRVAEHRAEGFATAVWQPARAWSVEAGIRIETSRLEQTGDSRLTKHFVFPKPRLALTWSSGPHTQWRLRLERDASQLDFADFVSSTSLTSSTITAGNADLEPQRVWTASLAWERRFWKDAAIVLTARHEWIAHTSDRVGIVGPGYAFDAPGNIGAGAKSKIEASLSLPLDRLGIAGGLITAEVGYRWTSVIDPTTGERRRISGEEPLDGKVHFTQDRPTAGLRWGIDYILPKREYEYRFDEIRLDRRLGRLSLFAEYKLAPRWTVRAYVDNITGRHVKRDRAIYVGSRDVAGMRYVEARDLATRPLAGLLLRRSFGD